MSMRTRTLLAWIAVGLIGLALAAGVTYAATQLSSQRIGLSAEPPSAGEDLAPPTRTVGGHRTRQSRDARGETRQQRGAEEREEHRRGSGDQDD